MPFSCPIRKQRSTPTPCACGNTVRMITERSSRIPFWRAKNWWRSSMKKSRISLGHMWSSRKAKIVRRRRGGRPVFISHTLSLSLLISQPSTFTHASLGGQTSTFQSITESSCLLRRLSEYVERYCHVEIDTDRRESSLESVEHSAKAPSSAFSFECQWTR